MPVEPGVFTLRYLSSACENPPRVFVEVSPVSRADVQVVFIPGKPPGVLERPKQLALVVAERKGYLQLTVAPSPGGGTSARVELEPLQYGFDTAGQASEEPPAHKIAAQPAPVASGPSLTCHVSKRGDICASPGDWIGGPGAPAVIEGVQINWDSPAAASLEYQILIQGARGQWTDWARTGQFTGTRGRGLALVGLRVRLTDTAPAGARLTGEAAFLGCPLIREQGRDLELASYAGVDPLVGLRLQLDWGGTASEEIVVGETERAEPEPMPAGAALRVFKSKRASDRGVGLGG
jgi:hypothetical protein